MKPIKLSPEQAKALKLMLSGKNIFLTGEAGTGKSTLLQAFREQCPGECVFLAPTGIAAIHINGATLHSFFLLKPGLMTPESMEEIGNKRRRALIRKVQTIVIDEISMVRSDVFWALDERLRSVARGSNQSEPFGGKQIILVGDFYQLPPVVKTKTEDEYLRRVLDGHYIFQTPLWQAARFSCIILKTVHRQQNDKLFLSILNQIRHGRFHEANIRLSEGGGSLNALEALNQLCVKQAPLVPEPIYLCATNREAQIINMTRKGQLEGKNILFRAIVTGRFKESDYPTPPILELKIGARVMLLNNKRYPTGEFEYVNGDTGIIRAIEQSALPTVQVELDNGRSCSIQPCQWTACEYELEVDKISGKEVIRQKEVGTFVQLPIKLAYAVTIHKAQGLSLERVHVKLGSGCFAHGQLYTALSRCRSIQNLRLDRPVFEEDVLLDPDVLDFYNTLESVPIPKNEVVLSIPKEHEAAVLDLLKKLQQSHAPIPSHTPARQPTENGRRKIPVKGKPGKTAAPSTAPVDWKIHEHSAITKLMLVYDNQTAAEQCDGMTQSKNGLGFNKIDAPVLTPIAEHYRANGYILKSELKTVKSRIQKYHKQWSGKEC